MPSNNASCSVSKNDAALVFKFPCKESSIRSLPKVNGPALNLWSSMSGRDHAQYGCSQSGLVSKHSTSTVVRGFNLPDYVGVPGTLLVV